MQAMRDDRAFQDVGNVILFEHVNVTVPDQRLATLFWIAGLGATRDPYLMVADDNLWANVGQQQMHMPTGTAQVLAGVIGLVMPDLDGLRRRLEAVAPKLGGTRFAWIDGEQTVEATCPWGNRVRVHAPEPCFGATRLGIPYVEFAVNPGCAPGIARFYQRVLGARCTLTDEGRVARVTTGVCQWFLFRESERPVPDYDGHHVALYIADFSGPYRRLAERNLLSRDRFVHEYRFADIVDPDSGVLLHRLEHEVRSLHNGLYGRRLVNRDPAQRQASYVPGRDAFRP